MENELIEIENKYCRRLSALHASINFLQDLHSFTCVDALLTGKDYFFCRTRLVEIFFRMRTFEILYFAGFQVKSSQSRAMRPSAHARGREIVMLLVTFFQLCNQTARAACHISCQKSINPDQSIRTQN